MARFHMEVFIVKLIRSICALFVLGGVAPSLSTALHAQTSGYYLTVENTSDPQERERMVNALTKSGFSCRSAADTSGNGVIHILVGPYATAGEVERARASFVAAGYQLPNAGSQSANAPSSLEAQALANLGGSDSPAIAGDLEAQALQALQSNSAEAERRQRLAAQQQAAAREIRRRQQASADAEREAADDEPASASPSAASILLQGLDQLSDTLAEQNARDAERNAAAMRQAQAQVEANNARRAAANSQSGKSSDSSGSGCRAPRPGVATNNLNCPR